MSTVSVSLKYPNGILMQVGDKELKLNGWNAKESIIVPVGKVEKVGITEDVPAEFWKAWLEKFKDHPLVVNGLIFASESNSRAKAESKERKGVKSGLEALDKDAQVGGVTKDPEAVNA